MGKLYLRVVCGLPLLAASVFAAAAGGPAVYTVGNVESMSPGAEGVLILESHKLVFRSGKVITTIPYTDIVETELGAKTTPPGEAPLYKVWRLHKRLSPERVMHQMITVEFADKSGKSQTMTLEMEEPAAMETLAQIEIRQGKRHRARNADPWWGDNLWKTPRNQNTVGAEALGNSPVK